MLVELAVRDLGVIDELTLVLGPGMTALTGETGAGKTLLVEAIELLVGGRADPALVRPGSEEARVEGRFVVGDDELVLARVIPSEGRSRAYVDGRLAPIAALAEHGADLVDLHGQHAHQSLLRPAAQRAALDRFAQIDLRPLAEGRDRLAAIDGELAGLGGDGRTRAREIDLLRFQVSEIEAAEIEPDEEAGLAAEEDLLASAAAHREAASVALAALTGEATADGVGESIAALGGRSPFREVEARLRGIAAELADVARELRDRAEGIAEDPDRLSQVQQRRTLLRDLRRKYGETLADVLAFRAEAAARLADLESYEERAARLEAARATAAAEMAERAAAVAGARRTAAPLLAAAVQAHMTELALPAARMEVTVSGDDPGDDVRFLFGANAGEPVLPLAKVASGGELARVMLALRLVLSDAPPTLVFDEVDAGVGGAAALAVGQALAQLGADHQVLVVTHLPQVAAAAGAQVALAKHEAGGRTRVEARPVAGSERVVEVSRMLSGQPDSRTARQHAEELLAGSSRHARRVRR